MFNGPIYYPDPADLTIKCRGLEAATKRGEGIITLRIGDRATRISAFDAGVLGIQLARLAAHTEGKHSD
ncbi:hypothetical protein [Corynebacterium sp. TAE3-ERU16]|uniref:hypothetical protein n=1 Tax=Corynebacterium sp. TAE3-ERU16 TaxID=2849493 RepID=UPI001C45C4C4|nr:hypothetical protein [Corynebacterium sp. TAE3-ERU16]MBV7292339.1 hypothetical protein [Corynebacterium sp. TAE3-ERU16]